MKALEKEKRKELLLGIFPFLIINIGFYLYAFLNYDLIYAEYWNDPDPYEYLKRKSIKCAEVLVPYKIDSQFIIAAAVKSHSDENKLLESGFDRKIVINKHLFFK